MRAIAAHTEPSCFIHDALDTCASSQKFFTVLITGCRLNAHSPNGLDLLGDALTTNTSQLVFEDSGFPTTSPFGADEGKFSPTYTTRASCWPHTGNSIRAGLKNLDGLGPQHTLMRIDDTCAHLLTWKGESNENNTPGIIACNTGTTMRRRTDCELNQFIRIAHV